MVQLKSRKFWLAVAAVLFFVTGSVTGNLTWDAAADGLWKTVLGYIGTEGAIDLIKGGRV